MMVHRCYEKSPPFYFSLSFGGDSLEAAKGGKWKIICRFHQWFKSSVLTASCFFLVPGGYSGDAEDETDGPLISMLPSGIHPSLRCQVQEFEEIILTTTACKLSLLSVSWSSSCLLNTSSWFSLHCWSVGGRNIGKSRKKISLYVTTSLGM